MTELDLAPGCPDPRLPATPSTDRHALWHRLAEASLTADTGAAGSELEGKLVEALAAALEAGETEFGEAVRTASSPVVARQIARMLDRAWRRTSSRPGAALDLTLFALPLIIVVAGQSSSTRGSLPGLIGNPEELAVVLRDGRALSGSESLALSNALVASGAFDLDRLSAWHAMRRDPDCLQASSGIAGELVVPAPMDVKGSTESVYLRFMVGAALHAPGVDLLSSGAVGAWGMPFTRALIATIGVAGTSVLPLPRPPCTPVQALSRGYAAQREVSAQLFVSNALRRFRSTVGEPTAVISAHRCSGAPGGGELRLSLSSPFEARDAEGFRCPLYPTERVADVASMLLDLLRECRVADVRQAAGIHADRVPGTAMPLLLKPETLDDGPATRLQ